MSSTYPAEAYEAHGGAPDTMTTSDFDRMFDQLEQQTLPAPSDCALDSYLQGLDVCRSALASPRSLSILTPYVPPQPPRD